VPRLWVPLLYGGDRSGPAKENGKRDRRKDAIMYLIIKVKNTDNIIGLKEEIAMRLEGVVDIERIDVRDEGGKR
jgi:hypothetical protein